MKSEYKLSGLFIAGGIASWVGDVVIDPCFLKMPFLTLFVHGSSTHDLIMRSYTFAAFLIFALASWYIAAGRRIAEESLSAARSEQTLTGLLPVCSWCKRIRDISGEWVRFESYIEQRSEAEFTHGICSDCEQKMR